MSELLIVLIVLSVLIVGGIMLFNWRQEKKFRRDMASKFTPIQQDVLINAPKQAKADAESFTISEPAFNQSTITEPALTDIAEQASITSAKSSVLPEKFTPEKFTPEKFSPEKFSIDASDCFEVPALNNVAKDAETEAAQSTDKTVQTSVQSTPIQAVSTPTASAAKVANQQSVESTESDLDITPDELNHQVDLMAMLFLAKPLNALATKANIISLLQLHTNIRAFGLDAEAKWQPAKVDHQVHFSKLVFGLQLADRGGPISKTVINRFQHAVETFGLENNAHVDWLNKGDASISATELDNFCMEVDQTVGFHVQANQGQFHGTKLKGLLEAQNFKLTDDGKFYLHPETLPYLTDFYVTKTELPMFSPEMLRQHTLSKITFKLEIPTVKNAVERFDEMVRLAKQLSHSLDASIVDEAGRVINDIHLEKIRQQLRIIQSKMIAKGIMPGESHALRLFF